MVSAFASEIDNERLMESKSHQERIKILQEADKCIASASTKEDYKKCENYQISAVKPISSDIGYKAA